MTMPTTELARVFERDLGRILRLYAIDEVFAEICRDYLSLANAKSDAKEALPHIVSSLLGLEEEIRLRLASEPNEAQTEILKPPIDDMQT